MKEKDSEVEAAQNNRRTQENKTKDGNEPQPKRKDNTDGFMQLLRYLYNYVWSIVTLQITPMPINKS